MNSSHDSLRNRTRGHWFSLRKVTFSCRLVSTLSLYSRPVWASKLYPLHIPSDSSDEQRHTTLAPSNTPFLHTHTHAHYFGHLASALANNQQRADRRAGVRRWGENSKKRFYCIEPCRITCILTCEEAAICIKEWDEKPGHGGRDKINLTCALVASRGNLWLMALSIFYYFVRVSDL